MWTIESSAIGGVGLRRAIGVISCIEFVSVRNCMRKMAHRARLIFSGHEAVGEYRKIPAYSKGRKNAGTPIFPKGMSDSQAERHAVPT
jgi:hypothetical protein